MDIEIYIERANKNHILAWLKTIFGELTLKIVEDDGMDIYQGIYDGNLVPISIQPIPEQIPSIGVWFNSEKTPWKTNIECGRDAFSYIGHSVLCDPGDEYPLPNQFLRIDKNGEVIVEIE